MNRAAHCPEKSQQASGCADVLTLLLDDNLKRLSCLTQTHVHRPQLLRIFFLLVFLLLSVLFNTADTS